MKIRITRTFNLSSDEANRILIASRISGNDFDEPTDRVLIKRHFEGSLDSATDPELECYRCRKDAEDPILIGGLVYCVECTCAECGCELTRYDEQLCSDCMEKEPE